MYDAMRMCNNHLPTRAKRETRYSGGTAETWQHCGLARAKQVVTVFFWDWQLSFRWTDQFREWEKRLSCRTLVTRGSVSVQSYAVAIEERNGSTQERCREAKTRESHAQRRAYRREEFCCSTSENVTQSLTIPGTFVLLPKVRAQVCRDYLASSCPHPKECWV